MQTLPGSSLILIIAFAIVTFTLLAIALRSFFQKHYYNAGTELKWVALIIFLPMIGPLLYLLFMSKSKKKKAQYIR